MQKHIIVGTLLAALPLGCGSESPGSEGRSTVDGGVANHCVIIHNRRRECTDPGLNYTRPALDVCVPGDECGTAPASFNESESSLGCEVKHRFRQAVYAATCEEILDYLDGYAGPECLVDEHCSDGYGTCTPERRCSYTGRDCTQATAEPLSAEAACTWAVAALRTPNTLGYNCDIEDPITDPEALRAACMTQYTVAGCTDAQLAEELCYYQEYQGCFLELQDCRADNRAAWVASQQACIARLQLALQASGRSCLLL